MTLRYLSFEVRERNGKFSLRTYYYTLIYGREVDVWYFNSLPELTAYLTSILEKHVSRHLLRGRKP